MKIEFFYIFDITTKMEDHVTAFLQTKLGKKTTRIAMFDYNDDTPHRWLGVVVSGVNKHSSSYNDLSNDIRYTNTHSTTPKNHHARIRAISKRLLLPEFRTTYKQKVEDAEFLTQILGKRYSVSTLDDIIQKETGLWTYIPNNPGWAGWEREPF